MFVLTTGLIAARVGAGALALGQAAIALAECTQPPESVAGHGTELNQGDAVPCQPQIAQARKDDVARLRIDSGRMSLAMPESRPGWKKELSKDDVAQISRLLDDLTIYSPCPGELACTCDQYKLTFQQGQLEWGTMFCSRCLNMHPTVPGGLHAAFTAEGSQRMNNLLSSLSREEK